MGCTGLGNPFSDSDAVSVIVEGESARTEKAAIAVKTTHPSHLHP
jgi:hypothetical protein